MGDPSVLQEYQIYTEQNQVEPIPAALLVLANAIKEAGKSIAYLGILDDSGNLNVSLSGSVRTETDDSQ